MWKLHSYALERVYLSTVVRAGDFDIVLCETEHFIFLFFRFPEDGGLGAMMCLVEGGEFLVAYFV